MSLPGQANVNATAGTTQFAGGTAVKPGNLFQIGSNTKAFTAVTLLQLEAEGKLSIEDPLGKFLPQYPLWHDVTIKRLLDMTSGIPTYDNDQAMQRAYAASPHKDFTPQALIAYVYPTTEGAPGPTTGWSYSNTNYVLAELIIEKVSGHTYAAELRQRFFTNPALHLGDSYYEAHEYPANVLKRMVAGYFYSNTPDNLGLAPLYGTDVKGLTLSWARGLAASSATPEDVTPLDPGPLSGRAPEARPAARAHQPRVVEDRRAHCQRRCGTSAWLRARRHADADAADGKVLVLSGETLATA